MEQNYNYLSEIIKKKIAEKDRAKLKYKQKLELVKQHYGVEFDVYYSKEDNIDKIKFSNLEFKNSAKNISIVYDNKIGKFNYIFYDYDSEQAIRNYDEKKIMNGLNREKKLKLVVAEIKRLNEEYKKELLEIDEKYKENNQEFDNELEYRKKEENS
ncbi:MAG: hypothetical protein ACI4OT_04205 [Bacilli bacterium]